MFVIFINWVVNKKCAVEFKIIKLKLKNKCQQNNIFLNFKLLSLSQNWIESKSCDIYLKKIH
jgi:hypothetical protein